jgi:hypothetical protein
VRQFIAAFLTALLATLLLSACSGKSSKSKDEDAKPKKKEEEPIKEMNTGKGSAIVRAKDPDTDGNRPIRYTIKWEKTQLEYTLQRGASKGRLEKVTGELYREGKLGCTFTADKANVDQEKKLLVLEGNVTAIGVDPQARLECRRLEWKTDEKLLKAFGRVTIKFVQMARDPSEKTSEGTIGPVDELWCLPDLGRAGTPGFYR